MADHGGIKIINSWVTKDEIYFVWIRVPSID
jgi:hypothetical protein